MTSFLSPVSPMDEHIHPFGDLHGSPRFRKAHPEHKESC